MTKHRLRQSIEEYKRCLNRDKEEYNRLLEVNKNLTFYRWEHKDRIIIDIDNKIITGLSATDSLLKFYRTVMDKFDHPFLITFSDPMYRVTDWKCKVTGGWTVKYKGRTYRYGEEIIEEKEPMRYESSEENINREANGYGCSESSTTGNYTTTTYATTITPVCVGCDGEGIQEGKDGIKVICPVCNGTGHWFKPAPWSYYYPYYYVPWNIPWNITYTASSLTTPKS